MMKVLWRHTLTDGHTVQVVQRPNGRKEVEIVAPWGASLETGGGAECVRFEVAGAGDFDALIAAVDEAREDAHGRETGQTGRSTSEPAPEASTGPTPENESERPPSNNSGRSYVPGNVKHVGNANDLTMGPDWREESEPKDPQAGGNRGNT